MDLVKEAGLGHALLAALLCWGVLKLLHPLAPRLNLLDFPVGRKDHAHPTPIIRGIAMVAGCLVVLAIQPWHEAATLVSFITASLLLVAVGLYDDRYDLRWY